MTLTLGDKTIVCEQYDSLLNSLTPLESLMTPPLYPNFINYDDYNTGAEVEHTLHISLMAEEIAKKVKKATKEEIEEYIKKPDFYPKLNVRTRAINDHCTSIEDSVLYRSVYETVVLNKGKKNLGFIKKQPLIITKFRLIKLSKEIYYLEELSLETTSNVYNYICNVVEAYASDDILQTEFDKLVWLEIKKRGSYTQESKITSNYVGFDKITTYISSIYGVDPKQLKWQEQGKISLDNRKRCVETGKTETLVATLRKK